MRLPYELELLRRRIGQIEGDLSEARRRLDALEAQARAEPVAAEAPVVAQPVVAVTPPTRQVTPPPLPVLATAPGSTLKMPGEAASYADETAFAEPPPWKTWLRRIQLWPPEEGGSNEVRLGAWWATRVGTLLAVIGVVFFGVYVSLNTPPWVKFAELLAICAGVAGLGLWLERKIARFGAVIFAGGLALLYFCAFAGYALPAVKVMTSAAASTLWQLAAVGLITAAALRRKSPGIATMAVGLGYVTAFFSRNGGLNDFALVTAGLLAVAAVAFHRVWRWEAPSVVALPPAYALFAAVLLDSAGGGGPAPWVTWGFLGGLVTLFFLRDWRSVRIEAREVGAGELWFQGVNSSLAAVVGVVAALELYRPQLATLYFSAALLLGVFAVLRRAQVRGDAIGAVFVAKASGVFMLGVIEAVDGRTTALALLVQAWVMAVSARRLESRLLRTGAGIVALVATVCFFRDAGQVLPLASPASAGALAFVAGLAWLPSVLRGVKDGKPESAGVLTVDWAAAVIAAVAAAVSVVQVSPSGLSPVLLVGVALLLGGPALVNRVWAPGIAAGLLLAASHVALWWLIEAGTRQAWWAVNAAAVLGVSVVVGAVLPGAKRADSAELDTDKADAGAVVLAATIGGLAHVLFAVLAPVEALAATSVLALGAGAAAGGWPRRRLVPLATWSAVLGVMWWFQAGATVSATGWVVTAVLALWSLPIGLQGSRRHAASLAVQPGADIWVAVQLAGALVVSLKVLPQYLAGFELVLAFAGLALALYGLTHWPKIRLAWEASWVAWVATGLMMARVRPPEFPAPGFEGALLLIVALVAWAPVVVEREVRCRHAAGVQAVLATASMVIACNQCFRGAQEVFGLTAALVVTVAIAAGKHSTAARNASLVLVAWVFLHGLALVTRGAAEGAGVGLAAVLTVAAAGVALPLVLKMGNVWRWLLGAAALALVFSAAAGQRGALDPYASVGWGLASILVFMTGLFARTRPYRMLGLIGLAVCIPRVFVVDLNSALYRIAAFVVLGLVLIWVGFSYHRFRHLITDDAATDTQP